jgi:hypothetical protein
MTRRASRTPASRAVTCARWFVFATALFGCTNDPDVVAHTVSDVTLMDAADVQADAAAPEPASGDAGMGPIADAGAPALVEGADPQDCDFADALTNAGLGDELLYIAATCKVPLWWFTTGVSGIDQSEILRILLGQTQTPKAEGHTLDACDLFFGVFYYDDPNNASNVILCPVVCDAFRARVLAGSELIECATMASPDAG